MHGYLIFDQPVRSSIPLPGLREWSGDGPCVRVQRVTGVADEEGLQWIHEWRNHRGEVTAASARRAEEYLLRFPGLGDFFIRLTPPTVDVFPAPEAVGTTIAHLLMDQVLPRLLCHQGRVILHASAVALPDDRGIAFIGDSGRGKSTLATSFYQSGCTLLTDDCLQLDSMGGQVRGLAAYPSLRLWPESIREFFSEATSFDTVTHYSSKQQLILRDVQRVRYGPAALDALFLLEDPASAGPDDPIRIEPISGAAAAMAMIEAAFTLDVASRDVVRESFHRTVRLARAGIPVFRLSYPRRFDRLPEVRAAIVARVKR
jgi:hypothetical protein